MRQPTDHEVETIQKIAKQYSYNYKFSSYEPEDIEQECFIIGLEVLDKYDSEQPLENFLRVCIKNRIKNFKRNKFFRYGCKCKDGKCESCKRKQEKKNIINPISIDSIDPDKESRMQVEAENNFDFQEIMSIIDEEIPSEYREDFLKMQSGVKISTFKRKKIQEIVKGILS